MAAIKRSQDYIKFIVYVVLVVLINLVGLTLFFRFDLTADNIYSLSKESREVVSSLEEPLTIKVFFSENLPPPHNGTERYLHDLLEEYAIYGGRKFNYRFYDVSAAEGSVDAEKEKNRSLAGDYGIFPIQIQAVEKDEVSFQKAYMGMVLIHGDLIERIPTIATTDGLEYKITMAVKKMNNKISALQAIDDTIHVDLYLSSALNQVAPFMQLDKLKDLPGELEKTVEKLNGLHYGKLTWQHFDPTTDPKWAADLKKYNIPSLKWPDLPQQGVKGGEGSAGLVMRYGTRNITVPVIQSMQIPLIGTHYEMLAAQDMENVINGGVEALVDINEQVAMLGNYGALGTQVAMPMGRQPASINNLRQLAGTSYSLKNVNLGEEDIPVGVRSMIIARPTEPFDDYALYQIDQFLMQGNRLAVFIDPFKETMPGGQQNMMFGGQGPVYQPLDTGLEKLLAHYGVTVRRAIVLDENSYRQPVPRHMGGGEQQLYFAPLIENRHINHSQPFMQNIKGLVALKASPLDLVEDRIKAQSLTATRLFSSSNRSWEMKDHISLNPMMMRPPADEKAFESFPLAYLLQGQFKSYFAGKSIPVKTKAAKEEDAAANETADDTENSEEELTEDAAKEKKNPELEKLEGQGGFIAQGKPAQIFVMGASDMLTDSVLDEEGRGPNAVFILNMLDHLNDRDAVAELRSKTQQFNPLNETGATTKMLAKAFNIVGLPILTALFGLLVWLRRAARKKRIQMLFQN